MKMYTLSTSHFVVFRLTLAALFRAGVMVSRLVWDSSYGVNAPRHTQCDNSDHIRRWSGLHKATFFKQHVCECVLGPH